MGGDEAVARESAPSQGAVPAREQIEHRVIALALLLTVLVPSAWSLVSRRQLGSMGGMADEWQFLGGNLVAHSVLGVGDHPTVFRPPAYPLFVAAVLRIAGGPTRNVSPAYLARSQPALFVAHWLILGASAVVAYFCFVRFMRSGTAFVAASLLGANAYSVVDVGLTRYDILHMAGVIAIFLTLGRLLEAPGLRNALIAGVVIGGVALIKSPTLVLPPFVLAGLWLRGRNWRAALKAWFPLCAGMALVVLPWTLRNYRVSGRLVPVNSQFWSGIWGSTVRSLPVAPDNYLWIELVDPFMEIYTTTTGARTFDIRIWLTRIDALEAAFKEAALANMRDRLDVYAANCLRSLYTLGAHLNTIQVAAFQDNQSGAPFEPYRLGVGHPRPFHHSPASRAFRIWVALVTGLAWLGGALAAWRRDPGLLPVGLVWLALWVGHSIVFVDFLHYALKVPFLFPAAFYLVDRLPARAGLTVGGVHVPCRTPVAVGLYAGGLVITAWVLAT